MAQLSLRPTRTAVALLLTATVSISPVTAQKPTQQTPEQRQARYEAHQGDFDYLLGDWEFTLVSKEFGEVHGVWSAVRLAEAAQILDEYRIVGDSGQTWYVTSTLRVYNAALDQWELVSVEEGSGLQNLGTGRRQGAEMHIQQRFGVGTAKPSVLRIRYYDIKPDRFSWTADQSTDEGKTWSLNHLQIQARRVGPARTIPALAVAKRTN